MTTPLSIPPISEALSPSSATSPQSFSTTSASSPPPLPPSSPRQPHSPTSDSPPPVPSTEGLDLVPSLHHAAQINDLSYLDSFPVPPAASSSTSPTSPPSPEFDVNLQDQQGITALHWASINGHLLFVKRLLSLGARVDLRGGELEGTALMWAARNGHLAIVHLLLKYSSDPTLRDSQSFNVLHLAVHSSSPFLVAYLLFTMQPLSVDTADEQGHTGLAWACYQGDCISVELLLKAGASVTRIDEQGLTPLHWAVTKGNSSCIKRIMEAGAELDKRDHQGKTARDLAIELKNFESYKRALLDLGRDEHGKPQDRPIKSDRNVQRTILLGLIGSMGFIFKTLEWIVEKSDNGWLALGVLMGQCYALHYTVTKVLLGVKNPTQSDRITKSNYLMSIITASLWWVGWVWLTRNLYDTDGYGFSNLLFGLVFFACCYNFWRAVSLDPGHVPYSPNDVHLKDTIEALVEDGRLNGMSFCLTCLVKRPLRSKHSYATGRCVGRFDHYCPWVWNDVGVNNHRQFLLFVSSLVLGVLMFIRLQIAYFSQLPSLPTDSTSSCSLLPSPICRSLERDAFALLTAVWAGLQLTWTVILLGVQIWQVCRQVTTLEVSNLGKFGYMGGKPGISAPHQQGAVAKFQAAQQAQVNHQLNAGGTAGDSDLASSDPASLSHAPTRTSMKPSGAFGFLLKLLGLDRFTSTHKALLHSHGHGHSHDGGSRRVHEENNPFDLGVRKNCLDFWTKGGVLAVDWVDADVEIPPGGFRNRVRYGESRRGLLGRGGGGGGGPTGGSPYERVALEQV